MRCPACMKVNREGAWEAYCLGETVQEADPIQQFIGGEALVIVTKWECHNPGCGIVWETSVSCKVLEAKP